MKTVTEFNGFQIKNARQKMAELQGENKSPEEVQQGLGEALKIEGDKLKHLLNAMEVAGGNDKVKRVVVMQAGEGEKVPAGATQKEEGVYMTELFPEAARAQGRDQEDSRDARGGRGGKRGDKKGDRKGGRRGPPRGPRGDNAQTAGEAAGGGAAGPRAAGPRAAGGKSGVITPRQKQEPQTAAEKPQATPAEETQTNQ